MTDRDVRSMYTVGARTAEKLNRIGIYTVRDIQDRQDEIIERFGKHGNSTQKYSRKITGTVEIPRMLLVDDQGLEKVDYFSDETL